MPKRILLATSGRVVTRESLCHKMWPRGTSVDVEHGLNTAVKKLRAVVYDDPDHPGFIETVWGTGYRFIADVNNYALGASAGGAMPPGGTVSGTASSAQIPSGR